MNSLSWMLYLIEVSGDVLAVTAFLGWAGLVIGGIGIIWGTILKLASEEKARDHKIAIAIRRVATRVFAVGIVAAAIATVIPSERTLYLIAGSELGETAVTSEDGQIIIDALRKKVISYLATPTGVKPVSPPE